VADYVIGLGRGLMEAAAKGKALLTFVTQDEVPALVVEGNFEALFETNFSPRNRVTGYDPAANYQAIRRSLSNRDELRRLQHRSLELFRQHFSAERAAERYGEVYRSVHRASQLRIWDLAMSFAYSAKFFAMSHRMGWGRPDPETGKPTPKRPW
jgi:glycosyltransferase involved in cell wall biosynthesis